MNREFVIIEEQPCGHSKIICEHMGVGRLLLAKSLMHRVVSSWDAYEICNMCGDNQLRVYVYPEGVSNEKELMVFYIKKYLELLAKGTITLSGKKVQCSAYKQTNVGYGNIWFIYNKPGSKKERTMHYRADDSEGLELIERLKQRETCEE